jgi:ethanolamine utilization protein EutQ
VGKCIIAVEDILEAAKAGRTMLAAPAAECIVTPGARDKAAELGITIADGDAAAPAHAVAPAATAKAAAAAPAETVVQEVCRLMKDRLPAGAAASDLEALVRSAVAARISGNGRPAAAEGGTAPTGAPDGVSFVSGARLLTDAGTPAPVPEAAIVADALRCGMESKLAAGYMEWQKAGFTRTVEFPEVAVVLEGELHLTVGGRGLTAKPGDMLYFRKGVQVAYSAPGRVRIACVNCTKD